MDNKKYVIVDIETTWLSRESHQITEIAAVLFDWKKILKQFQTLVNPCKPIPRFITSLTGIDDKMVADAPTICEALPGFFDFLEDHIMVAHNATFDYWFLNHNWILHLNTPIENHILCTRKLSNRLIPELTSKRLEILCKYFNITNQRAHRAMADVLATSEIFEKLLFLLKNKWIEDKSEIIKFQNLAMYKCL